MNRRLYPLAVFVAHGLLDTAVTFAYFIHVEDTTMESNPLLKRMLREALLTAANDGGPLAVHLLPAATLKLSVAGVAAALLWWLRPREDSVPVPGWRVWCVAIASVGALVVCNNVAAAVF